jgi:hypothetical protein
MIKGMPIAGVWFPTLRGGHVVKATGCSSPNSQGRRHQSSFVKWSVSDWRNRDRAVIVAVAVNP